MTGLSQAYYLKPVKIVRDSVHDYINLTKFDLELIDTIPFQRLSDVRQLTCQHVYPGARHTRFEHSLGVLELMRSSIKYLNRNRFLSQESGTTSGKGVNPPLFDASLEFNASVAALLHDVGHCPFSHMGETQFDDASVRARLVEAAEACTQLNGCSDLITELKEGKKIGSVHERLSCIVILRKYWHVLSNLTHSAEHGEESCDIEVDFELIIRSILGIEYKVDTTEKLKNNRLKNVIVRLLNSKIFDVDKLDYVMRDAYMTGIGTPSIDTQRLFRNMYLDDSTKCNLVFTSKAVPALQNMIDARDGLYLYVYNHHAVVYSDFLNTYISRRLSHNAKAFFQAVYPDMRNDEIEAELETAQISDMGLVPKSYLFSVDAVVEQNHSDSAWLSLLNIIHINYSELTQAGRPSEAKSAIKQRIRGVLKEFSPVPAAPAKYKKIMLGGEPIRIASKTGKIAYHTPLKKLSRDVEDQLADRIYNTMHLIHQFLTRYYLKPWWKTVFEFTDFMKHHFRDDDVRAQAGKFICDKGDHGLQADEMRSQIAKHVVYITQKLSTNREGGAWGLLEHLYDGDFFVIQRSTNFFSPDMIKGLEIALKSNEFLGSPAGVSRQVNEYYLKTLTNIIPQKDYSSIYAKEGFYVFSKQPQLASAGKASEADTRKRLKKHYELLEEIFVFVVQRLVKGGEQEFVEIFQKKTSEKTEEQSKKDMYDAFVSIKR